MRELPGSFQDFGRDHPEVKRAYDALVASAQKAGPLDERCQRLVKLAIAVGGRLEGAVRSHTMQAKEAGQRGRDRPRCSAGVDNDWPAVDSGSALVGTGRFEGGGDPRIVGYRSR
jgi:hypothetical protein